MWSNDNIDLLKGLTVKTIDAFEGGGDIMITTNCGRQFRFTHFQDCCEHVDIYSIDGDLKRLEGFRLVDVQMETVDEPEGWADSDEAKWADSYTFTDVVFKTNAQTICVKWFGESNGYYSEGVDFEELK